MTELNSDLKLKLILFMLHCLLCLLCLTLHYNHFIASLYTISVQQTFLYAKKLSCDYNRYQGCVLQDAKHQQTVCTVCMWSHIQNGVQ